MRNGNKKLAASAIKSGSATATTASPPRPLQTGTTTVPAAGPGFKVGGPTKPTSLYFVNAFVDYGVIGGLSIVTYLVLRFGVDNVRYAEGITVAAMLAWVCNWPHFSATNYRLYHSMDNIRQYPLTALVVPWFILAATVGAVMAPNTIAPFMVKLFFWWSSYHFCGQTFGITMIYARRAGFSIGQWERLGLNAFIYGSFLVSSSSGEILPAPGAAPPEFYGIQYEAIGVPEWLPLVFKYVMVCGAALFLFRVALWSIQNKRLLPPIILVPAVAQYIWFVLGAGWLSFSEFVPFFHCMQYLLIAWSMQLKEKMDLKQIEPSATYVVGESVRWGFVNIIGGAVLFFFLPLGVWALMQRVPPSQLLDATRDLFLHTGAPHTAGLPFYIGVTIIAVQIHHFFVDGVIWKLKRKSVSSPLMVNIHDMLEPAHAG